MAEWIMKEDEDKDGVSCYINKGELIRCRDCKHRDTDDCPMYFVEEIEWDDDGYMEYDDVVTDNTVDDGYCHKAERRTDAETEV
jgi:hypothetical protein